MNDSGIQDIYDCCVQSANTIRTRLDGLKGVVYLPEGDDKDHECLAHYPEVTFIAAKSVTDGPLWTEIWPGELPPS